MFVNSGEKFAIYNIDFRAWPLDQPTPDAREPRPVGRGYSPRVGQSRGSGAVGSVTNGTDRIPESVVTLATPTG